MAYLYGEELDRQKMWDRIGNGILVAIGKAGGDWERFINDMLVYIKADPGKTARNKELQKYIEAMIEQDQTYVAAWIRMFETRHMILVPLARHEYTLRREQLKAEWIEKNQTRIEQEAAENVARGEFHEDLL